MAAPDTIILLIVDYHAAIGEMPKCPPCLRICISHNDKMLRCNWLDAVDLSKTSCSQTALNGFGFVLDMSGSGRLCQLSTTS